MLPSDLGTRREIERKKEEKLFGFSSIATSFDSPSKFVSKVSLLSREVTWHLCLDTGSHHGQPLTVYNHETIVPSSMSNNPFCLWSLLNGPIILVDPFGGLWGSHEFGWQASPWKSLLLSLFSPAPGSFYRQFHENRGKTGSWLVDGAESTFAFFGLYRERRLWTIDIL